VRRLFDLILEHFFEWAREERWSAVCCCGHTRRGHYYPAEMASGPCSSYKCYCRGFIEDWSR
jgi:hypothetical protein